MASRHSVVSDGVTAGRPSALSAECVPPGFRQTIAGPTCHLRHVACARASRVESRVGCVQPHGRTTSPHWKRRILTAQHAMWMWARRPAAGSPGIRGGRVGEAISHRVEMRRSMWLEPAPWAADCHRVRTSVWTCGLNAFSVMLERNRRVRNGRPHALRVVGLRPACVDARSVWSVVGLEHDRA